MTSGTLLLVCVAALLAAMMVARFAPRLWLSLTLIAAAAIVAAASQVLFHGTTWERQIPLTLAGDPLRVRLDAISAFFLIIVGLIGGAAAVYTVDYWKDSEQPSAPWNRLWWSGLILSLVGVLLASNGLLFLIAWELFAVVSYFLITLQRNKQEVRAAGWLYLAASHAGTLALFAFFALLAARTGSWGLGPMQGDPQLAPLFWLALFGFGMKAGVFPLHIWLPSAHANAPSHVSAIMSGVTIKMGVYGLIRFSSWLPVPVAAGWTVMAMGAITAVLGIAFALAQNDLKRLLAYSSVENIGIIFIGLGGGLLGLTHGNAAWGQLALAGALLHVWNHCLFKSLLFFGAGSVLHATGTREMTRLGGLWRAMPWTTALFGLGAVAVCALPPLNGFVSEWLIYLGLFNTAMSHSIAAAVAMPAAILLGVTGALALATFTKAAATLFLGASRTDAARHAHEAGRWMRAPMVLVASGCVVLGLAPLLVWPALARTVSGWNPAWNGEAPSFALAAFAPAPVVVGVVLVVAALLLRALVRRRGVARSVTWDCGYAQPTARMQYTSASFAGIAASWFRWILQPERQLRRPRGFFPTDALRIEQTPETVLDCVIRPVGRAILIMSNAVRRFQHGHLQSYVAYVLVGLVGLAALVATGIQR